jgi:hypothetical protein
MSAVMSDQFQSEVLSALMLVIWGGAVAVGVAGRRSGVVSAMVTSVAWLVGAGSIGLAGAHLVGVLYTAAGRGVYYSYNFRFAALLLVGIMLVLAGALCVAAVPGLSRRRGSGWSRALSGALLLIIVATPLIPVQPQLAGAKALGGTVLLVVLLTARRWLVHGPTVAPAV